MTESTIAYRLMRAFLAQLVEAFYRQIEVVGLEHVPSTGPVIFAGNHPNSLHDPLLIIVSCGRVLSFAAKDVLFESAFLRPILRSLGAVPIARRTDHGGGAVDNTETFRALFEVLAAGGAMGIFPEGLSHDEAHLAKLKTGAARIALGVATENPGLSPKIIPCGLTYVHPKRFRSRALVAYGPPITVDDGWLQRFRSDERSAVRDLTTEIDESLRALTVNASDWDTLRVLDGVRRLYQPEHVRLEERTELARRFNATYPTVKDLPDVKAIYRRVEAYLDRLREAGLADRDLRRTIGPFEVVRKVLAHLALMFFWLPLALPGIPMFIPLLFSIRLLGPMLSPRKDVVATSKLVLGMISTFLIMAAITGAVAWFYGAFPALGTAALLFLSFHATLRVLERGNALKRLASTLARLTLLGREIDDLRTERAALERLVVAAVERHRPAEMTPLFPRTPEPTSEPS
jgi:glycerol-3-phosphate O-acyltransferase / dihydroxyacetone phosphate acyltransferase